MTDGGHRIYHAESSRRTVFFSLSIRKSPPAPGVNHVAELDPAGVYVHLPRHVIHNDAEA